MVCAVVFAGVEVETDVGKAIKLFISFLRYHYNNVIDTTDFWLATNRATALISVVKSSDRIDSQIFDRADLARHYFISGQIYQWKKVWFLLF